MNNATSGVALQDPIQGKQFVVRMTDPPGFSDVECHLDDLLLDGVAPIAPASGGGEALRSGGFGIEQSQGVWEVFGRLLSDASPPDAVFPMPFPPSCERPLPSDVMMGYGLRRKRLSWPGSLTLE